MATEEFDEIEVLREVLRTRAVPVGAKVRVRGRVVNTLHGRRRPWRQVLGWPVLIGVVVSGGVAAARSESGRAWWSALTGQVEVEEQAREQVASKQTVPPGPASPRPTRDAAAPRNAHEVPPASDDDGGPSTEDLTDEPLHAAQRGTGTAVPARTTTPGRGVRDAALALQIEQYKHATSITDPRGVIHALRAFKQRWPRSPLLHEVDLQLVAALQRAGDGEGAKGAARSFLKEHPDSGRAEEVRKLAGQQR